MTRQLAPFASAAEIAYAAAQDAADAAASLLQPATPTETAAGLYNVSWARMPYWRAAIARVRAGTGRGKLLMVGDSTTSGTGSGSGGTSMLNGAFATAPGRGVAALLAAVVATSDKSLIGDQGVPAILGATAYGTYDTRVVQGAGWNAAPTVVVGGNAFRYQTGAASIFAFTPAGAFDNFKIWYIKQTPSGGFAVNVDGGASLGTVSTTGAGQTVGHSDFTVTRGTHTINLTASNDNQIIFLGIEVWDSTVPAIDIVQAGWHGSKIGGWASVVASTTPWIPVNFIPTLAPDLTVINLTINDSNAPTALATYQAQMQVLITAAKTTGDVLLVAGAPSDTAFATNGTLDRFVDVLRLLARTNGCGLLDIPARWGSYAAANPLFPYSDLLHPGAVGYQDIAQAIVTALTRD